MLGYSLDRGDRHREMLQKLPHFFPGTFKLHFPISRKAYVYYENHEHNGKLYFSVKIRKPNRMPFRLFCRLYLKIVCNKSSAFISSSTTENSPIDRLWSVGSRKPNWLRLRFQVKRVDQTVPNSTSSRFAFRVLAIISCVWNTKSNTMYFLRRLSRSFEASDSLTDPCFEFLIWILGSRKFVLSENSTDAIWGPNHMQRFVGRADTNHFLPFPPTIPLQVAHRGCRSTAAYTPKFEG